MAFEASRPDRARLARVPFGDAWLALDEPSGECDPFDVRVRMAMYRLLVERGNPHGELGAHDELSPYWGYASQLDWQHRSGRLGDPAIAKASWWGACNYALSVVPYVAAARLGVVPTLELPPPAPAYAPAIAAWHEATRAAMAVPVDHDRLRLAIWRAHLTSIEIAVARHRDEYATLPAAEQRFARGWVRMVDLFGAAAIRTDLARLVEVGGGSLPPRILDDRPLDDLSRHERSTVRRVSALGERPSWRWTAEVRAWRRVTRSRAARAEAETLLAAMLGRASWPIRLRAVAYAALPVFVLDSM